MAPPRTVSMKYFNFNMFPSHISWVTHCFVFDVWFSRHLYESTNLWEHTYFVYVCFKKRTTTTTTTTTTRQHDTETPDLVQTQIPSHTGIKYLVRRIPPSDVKICTLSPKCRIELHYLSLSLPLVHIPRLRPIGGRD